MRRSEAWRRLGLRAVLGAGLFFLYAPIVSVILFSFNSTSSAAVLCPAKTLKFAPFPESVAPSGKL